jgi:asparagine synthase (glutamine-hydrolysing)
MGQLSVFTVADISFKTPLAKHLHLMPCGQKNLMCGIFGAAGQLHWDTRIAFEAMRRRGPDDRGLWEDQRYPLALGHLRLSIIDTSSNGHQPMVSHNGRFVMVYNGELYNYRELRSELEKQGVHFHGQSDSEVLLEMFAQHGQRCFERFNGMFAVAIWDRDTQVLTLARDHMGLKPLYWTELPEGFAFASEIKALLRSGLVKAQLHPDALARHLTFLWTPGEETLIKGVMKLRPGHVMQVKDGKVVQNTAFWDMSFEQQGPHLKPDWTAMKVAQTVEQAVKRQMVADVPLGAFLSGGMDSSSVVAFAQKHLNETANLANPRLQCFSMELRQLGQGAVEAEHVAQDLFYARKVAAHVGADLHHVQIGQEMMERLPEMIYLLDEPIADPSALNTLLIAELARSQGITVLLSGAGGDDIFTGYRRHFAYDQERWWSNWPQGVRSMMASVAKRFSTNMQLSRRIAKAYQYADLDVDERLISYFQWCSSNQALDLLSKDFRKNLDKRALLGPMLQSLGALPNGTEPLNKMLYLECKHFLADHNLHYKDKMGMASSIEIRSPLLDMEVVNMATRLPVHYKQHGSTGKWIFKKAMEPFLPHEVIYRSKVGFGLPLKSMMETIIRPMIEDLLSAKSLQKRGVFDPHAVQQMRDDDRAGKVDATYTIFTIACIELWCRQNIDGDYPIDQLL